MPLPHEKSHKRVLRIAFVLGLLFSHSNQIQAQSFNVILGRSTNVAISVMFNQNSDYLLEYGMPSGRYSHTNHPASSKANTPVESEIINHLYDTRCYYRLRYRPSGTESFQASPAYSFQTQRKYQMKRDRKSHDGYLLPAGNYHCVISGEKTGPRSTTIILNR
jgi:hypothetical protein